MNKTRLAEFVSFRRAPYAEDKSHRFGDYFGIELELENIDYDAIDNMDWNYWVTHGDGSLQEDGREFVLSGPKGGDAVVNALNEFYNNNVNATAGLRTSTHIHINASDLTVGELRSMLVVSYTVEAALFRWIGENRKWCGYAMSLAEMPSDRLRKILTGNTGRMVLQAISAQRNNDRYYGVNVSSIVKHGTVEYRHFPGKPTREELENWLDFVRAMKRAGQTLPFPELGERIETEQQLRDFLASVIPGNVWSHLRSVEIAGEFWQSFNEIMALSEPNEDIERMDRLVFMKPQLLRYFVKNNTLTPNQAEELNRRMTRLQVMTVRDFHAQMREIRSLQPEGETRPRETEASFIEEGPNPNIPMPDFDSYARFVARNSRASESLSSILEARDRMLSRNSPATYTYAINPFIATDEPAPEPESPDDINWDDDDDFE